jgi:hypothetical protein
MANMKAREGEEVWEMQSEGTVCLLVTGYNRFNQPTERDLIIGPNQSGRQFRITAIDREYHQQVCVDASVDPFRNGMLVQRDGERDEEVASDDALDLEGLVAILEMEDAAAFEERVKRLGEFPLRRLQEVAEMYDSPQSRVDLINVLVEEKTPQGKRQESIFDSSKAEKIFG